MTIVNLGSCCIDHVYRVPHFVAPGETLPCASYDVHPGGKGLNQSIALARAGATVSHAGKIGSDGLWLKSLLDGNGVDTSFLIVAEQPSGHANIQISDAGENAIVLYGGTNQQITTAEIDAVLANCETGTFLVIQNEISNLHHAVTAARAHGLRIVFNVAPMTPSILELPFENIELLIFNEVEGEALSGQTAPDDILDTLSSRYPDMKLLLTLGSEGARYRDGSTSLACDAPAVEVLDTTGAGDTFTGYFLAEYANGTSIEVALRIASAAAALSVTRNGAASSIPTREEINQLL